ncbi:MAG: HIT domain-containing protein [Thermodesulfovibrionales bacterium]|nr:HIT domain-containing protein [Thermodesulfovibrionales bacterium]
MHELRKDPLLNRWVAILDYSLKPEDYARKMTRRAEEKASCVFCAGREAETPPEIAAIRANGTEPNTPGWAARVIPNPKPILHIEGDLDRRGVGMYDRMNSVGANEILIETPEHGLRAEDMGSEQVKKVFSLYKERMADLEKDARMRYIFICKNSGRGAGAMYSHSHSEITATPVIPKLLKEELDSAKHYYAYKERCIFCDIMTEEQRAGARVIADSGHFIAFCPYAPKFPFDFWVMPKRHSCAFQDMSGDELDDLSVLMTSLLKKLRGVLDEPAFHYVVHTAPNRIPRRDHWHTLGDDFHWHIEVTPRLVRSSGFEWGSDFYVLTTTPEDAAKYLKEA